MEIELEKGMDAEGNGLESAEKPATLIIPAAVLPGRLPFKMVLNSPGAVRRTMARCAQAVAAGTITAERGSKIAWILSLILQAFKNETEADVARRISALEDQLARQGDGL
jgi:hypothetical protein